ncbi:MAG: endonuclease/exonuclease/phosphatase family protein, partial [Hyphomicrobiales bacterium]|nr:endonuclease/exonuclease/phosphatase family protein [Hyphomicrobiales bacterium]
YMEAVFSTAKGVVRAASIYLPNGNPPQTEKYPYKLGFMERLRRRAASLLRLEEPLVLAGDYNVIPEPIDARDPAAWVSDALFLPQTRAAFRRLLALGLTDALRACDEAAERYSFWDYQAGAFQKNNGIRIDHLLLSPQAADTLVTCRIDKETRSWDKPSDHVPVVAELNIG